MEQTLVDLVKKVQDGDQEAFNELYETYRSLMMSIAYRHVHNEADAEDIVQNASIKIFQNINSLEDPAKFEGWMKRIVANQALDHLKSAPKKYNIEFSALGDSENELEYDPADEKIDTQPEMAYDEVAKREIVDDILNTLSEEQKLVTIMYFYDQMTMQEIADELGIKYSTVLGRLTTAKKAIKEEVVSLEKKEDIKLYNMAPLPFFLFLLGNIQDETINRSALGGAIAATATTTTTTATATTGSASAIATKAGLSTAAKLMIAGGVALGGIGGYFGYNTYQNNQIHKAALDSLNLILKVNADGSDMTSFEYGNEVIDAMSLVSEHTGDLSIEGDSTIDTHVVGDKEIVYVLKTVDAKGKDAIKKVPINFSVNDTTPPEVVMSAEKISVQLDSEADLESLVTSVSDPIDGDLTFNQNGAQAGQYTFDGNIDYTKEGEYTVNLKAIDINGNETTKAVVIEVTDKSVYWVLEPSLDWTSINDLDTSVSEANIGNMYVIPETINGVTPGGPFDTGGYTQNAVIGLQNDNQTTIYDYDGNQLLEPTPFQTFNNKALLDWTENDIYGFIEGREGMANLAKDFKSYYFEEKAIDMSDVFYIRDGKIYQMDFSNGTERSLNAVPFNYRALVPVVDDRHNVINYAVVDKDQIVLCEDTIQAVLWFADGLYAAVSYSNESTNVFFSNNHFHSLIQVHPIDGPIVKTVASAGIYEADTGRKIMDIPFNSGDKITLNDKSSHRVKLFSDGYIPIQKDGKWAFIDSTGNGTDYVFDDVSKVYNGKAYVKYDGKYGILDLKKTMDERIPINDKSCSKYKE